MTPGHGPVAGRVDRVPAPVGQLGVHVSVLLLVLLHIRVLQVGLTQPTYTKLSLFRSRRCGRGSAAKFRSMASYPVNPHDPDDTYLGFWRERHLCTLTTLRPDGTPHVVPVGVTYDPEAGLARVIANKSSTKVRNVQVGGPTASRSRSARWTGGGGRRWRGARRFPRIRCGSRRRYGGTPSAMGGPRPPTRPGWSSRSR